MTEHYTYDDIQIVPSKSYIKSREQCYTGTTVCGLHLDVPIISSPMDTVTEGRMANELARLGGMGVIHRFMNVIEQVNEANRVQYGINAGTPTLACAIGLDELDTGFNRVCSLMDYAGVNVFVIDTAHGHLRKALDLCSAIKSRWNVHVILGSICTVDAASDAITAGATGLRVGVGNGSNCTTRIKTGVGVPQASAISEIYDYLLDIVHPVTLIADGGIRTPGDVAKALALGADAVMLGSILAGTREAPGAIIRQGGQWPHENLWKKYTGAASYESKTKRGEEGKNVEGVSRLVPYTGKVERIVDDIKEGIQSAMSYVGAWNLEEFKEKAQFVKVTQAAQIEAKPHGLIQ